MRPTTLVVAIALVACSDQGNRMATAQHRGVDPRPPNGIGQQPAFEGQTDAPEAKTMVEVDAIAIVRGLEHPWGLDFTPDGRMLVTERPGRLRVVTPDWQLSQPVVGLPAVDARGQGGLLDVAVDPHFASSRLVYWSYAESTGRGTNHTAVARGRLVDGTPPRLEGVEVVFRQQPSLRSTLHFGSRLVWAPDGTLFVTLGERSVDEGRTQAQQLDSLLGKVVRIHPDGTIPTDNPFVGTSGVHPEIWSFGHRNVQGAAIHPSTGALWTVEHGPRGGDELNVARAANNYGWPTITYGIEYDGRPVGRGLTQQSGMEQPVYYWDPVIAPSGMTFYTGDLFPVWKGSLFIGGLVAEGLVRLAVDGELVTGEEWLLRDFGERIRDVVQGPNGALYLLTDSPRGRLLKLG